MGETITVIKTFLFTLLILMMMQVKIGGYTIEARLHHFVTRSAPAVYIQTAAAGGVLAIRNLAVSVKNSVSEMADSYKQGANEQKAGM